MNNPIKALFNWLANTDTTREDNRKTFLAKMAELQKQIDQYNSNYEANMIQRQAKINEIYEARKKIVEERIEELIYIDERYKELKAERKRVNRLTAQYIVLVLFNYTVGYSFSTLADADERKNFINQFKQTYDRIFPASEDRIRELVYWLLCKVSVMLPLVWPTGSGDDEIHEYEVGATSVNEVAFRMKVGGYVSSYTLENLKRYTFNVCLSNCFEFEYDPYDEDWLTDSSKRCKDYISNLEDCLTDDAFVAKTYDFLKQFNELVDIMRFKSLAARARKGITSKKIHLLPKYYPKNSPKYELYEALTMILNTLIYQYGDIQNKDGTFVATSKTSKPSDTTDGGMCFELNEDYIKKCYSLYYDFNPNNIWNTNSFVRPDEGEINIKTEDITGSTSDEKWMKDTKLCKELFINNPDPTSGVGRLKYFNPTRRYTYTVLKDDEVPDEEFALPKIRANMSALFQYSVLFNLHQALSKDKKYEPYSLYFEDNKWMFTSFDFLTCVPKGKAIINRVSPTCRFMYEFIMAAAMKWHLIFPIDNTVTMSKINANISTAFNGAASELYEKLPQYIWAGNETEASHAHGPDPKSENFSFYSVQPIRKSMKWELENSYATYIKKDNAFHEPIIIFSQNQPKKDAYGMFDASFDNAQG